MPNFLTRTTSMTARVCLCLLVLPILATAPAQSADDAWAGIRKEFYGSREISDVKPPLVVEAPDKAEDAALVPISIHILPEIADDLKSLRIFIDNNPMPLVGAFGFGKAAGFGSKTISTRVRFDTFSWIRAVAETNDGRLFMGMHFVKASGGCSSPALKDAQAANESAGQMNLKKIIKPKFASQKNSSSVMGEAVVMLKHPNYSGMQMDPASGQFIPAKYLKTMEVTRDGELVFHLEAGISMSANPNVRFTYGVSDQDALEAKATDSDGAQFSATAPPGNT